MPNPDTFPTTADQPFQVQYARIGRTPIPTAGSLPATKTLLASESGAMLILDKVDGIILTLPAPQIGLQFDIFVKASVTSNSYKVITSAGTIFLFGSVLSNDTDTAGAAVFFDGNGTTHVAVTMNGTTTGGRIGTRLRFTCVSSTLWHVEGVCFGSGAVATPFATS